MATITVDIDVPATAEIDIDDYLNEASDESLIDELREREIETKILYCIWKNDTEKLNFLKYMFGISSKEHLLQEITDFLK
jgi:hypothetical protein